MEQYTVLKETRNGFLLLESTHGKAIGEKKTLYSGTTPAALLLETIASVKHPLYIAKPLVPIKTGAALHSRR